MKTPETSPLFTPWKNPVTGVESLILTERPASVQTQFYYTHPSFTNDGRYLWLHCKFVAPGGRSGADVLGVVDFELDELRVYHETAHNTGRPVIDLATGDAYWFNDLNLYKRGPRANDVTTLVNKFPANIAAGRKPERIATHLTFCANGKSVNFDARFGNDNVTYLGELPLDGSPATLWEEIDGFFDHGLFSPIDPDLMMFACEYWQYHAPFDGKKPYHRLWMIRRGGKAEPILKQPVSHSGHEWFDVDGEHVWYVHYGVGIKRVNLKTRAEENLWPARLAHGYSDRTGKLLIADTMADPVVCDCIVIFKNLNTGKEVELVHRGPLAPDLTQCGHLHPHPHFCNQDKYVCYTTTVHDRVDLALTNVSHLVQMTK